MDKTQTQLAAVVAAMRQVNHEGPYLLPTSTTSTDKTHVRSLTAHLEEDELDEFHFTAMDRRLSQTHLQPRAPTPIHVRAPTPGHSPRTSQIPILATTGRASAARERRSSSAISRAAAAAASGHGGDSLEVIMRVARNSGVVDRTTGAGS